MKEGSREVPRVAVRASQRRRLQALLLPKLSSPTCSLFAVPGLPPFVQSLGTDYGETIVIIVRRVDRNQMTMEQRGQWSRVSPRELDIYWDLESSPEGRHLGQRAAGTARGGLVKGGAG